MTAETIKSEIDIIDAALKQKQFYSPHQVRALRVRRARLNKILKSKKQKQKNENMDSKRG
jgi:hypothetical protein